MTVLAATATAQQAHHQLPPQLDTCIKQTHPTPREMQNLLRLARHSMPPCWPPLGVLCAHKLPEHTILSTTRRQSPTPTHHSTGGDTDDTQMHPMLNATTVDITASNRDHATDAPNTATATTTGPQPRPCNDQRQHQKHAVNQQRGATGSSPHERGCRRHPHCGHVQCIAWP